MAAKRQRSTTRAASGAAKAAPSNGGRRVRMGRLDLVVHEPAETDPKKRAAAIKRAGSIIKTTAQIDTITLGRD